MDASKQAENIDLLLDKAVKSLTQLDKLYTDSDIKRKRQIIGSISPEKRVFDGFGYRTARMNEAVDLICSVDKGLAENENGQTETNFNLSTLLCPGLDSDWAYISLRYEDRVSKMCRLLVHFHYKYKNCYQKLSLRVS